jgi:aryl-alcohol dehydrogenase-like predicted oxidoreductase
MKTRKIGDAVVSEIGLGCMNLSHAYGAPPPPEQARALLLKALDLGVTHFDTAALYGFGRNEELLGPVLRPFRQRIHLASKCGITGVNGVRVIDGRPATLIKSCHESLARLQTEVIDLFYLHRVDRKVPVEDSMGALAELVQAGHIRAIGLSEVSAATLRRAHAVHPVAAVQSEYSLWTRNPEVAVLETCRELGIAFVAFSPVARGFLTGAVTPATPLLDGDIRKTMPRFEPANLLRNLELLKDFSKLAIEQGCSMAQLALAWLLHKSDNIIPIPGTTHETHLIENCTAGAVKLTARVVAHVETLINSRTVSGARYSAAAQAETDAEEIPAQA